MHIHTVADFRRAIRLGPHAWPGGYDIMMLTEDGGTLCHTCATSERRNIVDSISTRCNDGWRVVGVFTTAECDDMPTCDHCGVSFSAY